MIKYFYKIFSTLVLVLALLNLQITPTYAQAEGQEQEQESDENQESNEAEETNGNQADRPSPSDSEEDNESEQNGEPEGEMASRMMSVSTDSVNMHLGDMLVFLVLIAVGLFLVSIWKYQVMALDMQIAMGAGILQIASVISTIFATRADIDASTYKIEKKEDGTVNNMQVDALKEQKKSYESLRDHAALKWKIEAAGAAAYAGAAYMAWSSKSKLDSLFASCGAIMKKENCVGYAIPGVMKGNMEAPMPSEPKLKHRKTWMGNLKKGFASCEGNPAANATPQTKAAEKTRAITTVTGTCTPLIEHLTVEEPLTKVAASEEVTSFHNSKLFEKMFFSTFNQNYVNALALTKLLPSKSINAEDFVSQGGLDFLGSIYTNIGHDSSMAKLNQHPEVLSYQERLLNIAFPKAHALDTSSVKWLGLSATAGLAFTWLRKDLVRFIDQYTTNPGHRAIMYLGASAVSSAAAYMSFSAMGQAEDNIKKIDEMLEKLGNLQDMGKKVERTKIQDISLSGALDPLDPAPQIRLSREDDPISCNRPPVNGKCPSVERGIRRARSFRGINPSLGEIGTLTGGIADDILGSSSLGAGTVGDIENLADKNAIAKRALRQIQAHENKKRKKNGQKPVDFEKQANGMMSRMAKIAKESLAKQGSYPSALMASMGYPESMRSADEDMKKKLSESLREADGVAASGQSDLSSVSPEDESFNFDFGEEEAEEGEIFQGDLDEYNSDMYAKAFDAQAAKGSDQIVGDRDVSIFRVISVRYMKSGLPKLLEESGPQESRLEGLE